MSKETLKPFVDLNFFSGDPAGAFAQRFTAVYGLLMKKAAAKATTANHATAEPGAGPIALRQQLSAPIQGFRCDSDLLSNIYCVNSRK